MKVLPNIFQYKNLLLLIAYHVVFLVILFVLTQRNITVFSIDHTLNMLRGWDGLTYLFLAKNWYQPTGEEANFIAFFPLYPLLIKILTLVTGNFIVSGLLISITGSILGHYYFIKILEEYNFSPSIVKKSLLLLLLSPMSMYFFSVYTEGLFFGLTLSFFYALKKKHYTLAASLGGLSALTRLVGIITLLPLCIEVLQDKKVVNFRKKILLIWSSGIVISSGFLLYLCLNYYYFGNPFYYQLALENYWQKMTSNPFVNYTNNIRDFSYLIHNSTIFTYVYDVMNVLLFPLIFLIYAFKKVDTKIPLSWIVWGLAHWVVITSQSYWLSSTRYVMLIFPLYIMLAQISEKSRLKYIIFILYFVIPLLWGLDQFARFDWVY